MNGLDGCYCERTCNVKGVVYREDEGWTDGCRNCTCTVCLCTLVRVIKCKSPFNFNACVNTLCGFTVIKEIHKCLRANTKRRTCTFITEWYVLINFYKYNLFKKVIEVQHLFIYSFTTKAAQWLPRKLWIRHINNSA